VGREADVARVIDLLLCRDNDTDGQLANIAAANGMGGIGKTALATEVVRRLVKQGAFPDGIAVYDARKRTDPLAVLRAVLARFTPGRKEPGADALEKLGDFAREIFKGKHALVVLDNVELHWPIDRVIEPLRSAGAVVLSTSRAELPVVPVEAQVKLELLPLEEAIELFVEYYGRSKYHESDVAAVTALVAALRPYSETALRRS
jgi:predicted ATPase